MKGENVSQCKICGENIDPKIPFFVISFNKEAFENGTKKIIRSEEGASICEECGEEGLTSVLRHLKLIHDSDTELNQKMQSIEKSINMEALMKEFGIS